MPDEKAASANASTSTGPIPPVDLHGHPTREQFEREFPGWGGNVHDQVGVMNAAIERMNSAKTDMEKRAAREALERMAIGIARILLPIADFLPVVGAAVIPLLGIALDAASERLGPK